MGEAWQSGLWSEAFVPSGSDPHSVPRRRLHDGLMRMRTNVASLISIIPADCKDLTVHDISHLDSLWEMATLIAGPHYELNPAEAFVLGGAILLHDAGLSAAAYRGGLVELKKTQEWQDLAAGVLRQQNLEPTAAAIQSPPPDLLGEIKFAVLRALHAQQAERLSSDALACPDGQHVYLLDDAELRQAFGAAIGRVARSHHWGIERLADTLTDNIGTGTELPAEWHVSERKVACLLRCADAAHIDRRRAPTILYAAIRPNGIAGRHWLAQNRLNKPSVDQHTLIYSSGQPFKAADADAWWLAYDLVRSLDKEIRGSNALLEEIGVPQFQVQRVLGAENPRAFSKRIRPEGWRPIDAEVRVSDPVHLAQTFGGRRLYGGDVLAPVRELLQNCADAIRARREIEDRPQSWGLIRITVESLPEDASGCWFHVDDTGIGMTERILAGPLIDFGRSIWNSPLLREEFPGLQSRNMKPVGKFGIGFFSVFELAKHVKVASKQYLAAVADAKVLEFQSLSARPLIRSAESRELPRDFSTRVSLKVDNYQKMFGPQQHPDPVYADYRMMMRRNPQNVSFENGLLRLISLLDIQVEYTNKIDGTSFVHSPDIYGVAGADFLDELLPDLDEKTRDHVKLAHAAQIRPLEDSDGSRFGRAALLMLDRAELGDHFQGFGFVSVGGFVYRRGFGQNVPYVGVLEGTTDDIGRRVAYASVPERVIQRWATEQGTLIDQTKFLRHQLLRSCQRIIAAGGNPGSLPYCFVEKSLVCYENARERIAPRSQISIPLSLEYSSHFSTLGYGSIGATFFELAMKTGVFVLAESEARLLDDEVGRLITKEGRREVSLSDLQIRPDGPLSQFLGVVRELWDCEPRLSIESAQLFQTDLHSPPDSRWVLALSRPAKNR